MKWLFVLFLCLQLTPASFAYSDDMPMLYQASLSKREALEYGAMIDNRIAWVYRMTQHLGRSYTRPSGRPKVYLVSRAYIVRHAREVCFSSSTSAEANECAERVFGWIDDQRDIYLLRGEDVLHTKDFPTFSGFSPELWVGMELTHELVHYVQMEGSPYVPTNLPCAVEAAWESEAHFLMSQWLHTFREDPTGRGVDAERINTALRGQMQNFACAEKLSSPTTTN